MKRVHELDSLDDDLPSHLSKRKIIEPEHRKCPYLDTINRNVLDFDCEKLCSQTLSNRNVYVCLVCGKFYEGRGKSTPAYTHSLQFNHYVYLNVDSGRSYCLPDGYEVVDASLSDIQKCLSPTFSFAEIANLDKNSSLARDIFGVSFLPGFVGLNNLNATDGLNVLLHLLSHVAPFRDFFLQPKLYQHSNSKLVREFGLIIRKLWSPYNFKSTISPQELIQIISVDSKRAFTIGSKCDVLELLVWLLKSLALGIESTNKTSFHNNIIYEPFQGTVEVTTLKKKLVSNFAEQQLRSKLEQGSELMEGNNDTEWVKSIVEVPFTYLSLDIPPIPLFRDSQGGLVIPQLPLFQLLSKFDGEKWNDTVTKEAHFRKQYRIKRLPRYLVLHLVRFTKNNFSVEKNPTIVTFPVRNLEMKDFLFANQVTQSLDQDIPRPEEITTMSIEQLQNFIQNAGSSFHQQEMNIILQEKSNVIENLRIVSYSVLERVELFKATKYDLIANITHVGEGSAKNIEIGDVSFTSTNAKQSDHSSSEALYQGNYKIHLPCKATGQWYEIEDLQIAETTPQHIGVSESYILVYEKKL